MRLRRCAARLSWSAPGRSGLALAIDLAQRAIPVVLLDNDNTLSTGSRAICFAKRTLEIFDRLGCGDRMVDKGVSWNVGKVFFKDEQVYSFDLLPERATRARPSSTCSNTTSKATWPSAPRNCR
jgi:3-(3-hydroxy-phenyl)propionate hydroxylase